MKAKAVFVRSLAIILLFSLLGCGGGGGGQHQPPGPPPPGGPPPQSADIAFRSSRALDGSDAKGPNGTSNLWVIHSDGTGATAMTKLTAAHADVHFLAWSPDASKIAFDSQQALDGSDAATLSQNPNIWVMKSDGTGATPLTKLTSVGVESFLPAWSPDGSKILFTSTRALDGSDAGNTNLTRNLWVISADGSGARPLTKFTAQGAAGPFLFGSWSPNGNQVLFFSAGALDGSDAPNANRVLNVWVMNADGTGAKPLTRLTASGANSFTPVWSPDGAKLAFVANRALDGSDSPGTATNIWVMNADGSAPAPLTKQTAQNVASSSVRWSPNSARLAFVSNRALDGFDSLNPANKRLGHE